MDGQKGEQESEFLTRVIPLAWSDLTRIDKNELVHIWIMGRQIGSGVPNYCGSFDAAFEVVKRLQHVKDEVYFAFMKSLPPIYAWTPELLVYSAMKAFDYRDHRSNT